MIKVKEASWIYGTTHYLKGDPFPKNNEEVTKEEIESLIKSGMIEEVADKKEK
jgi:hypothetical protein